MYLIAAKENFENKKIRKYFNNAKYYWMTSPAYTGMIRTLYAKAASGRLEYELKEPKELINIKEKINKVPYINSDHDNTYHSNEPTKIKVIDHLRKSRAGFRQHDILKDLENNIMSNPSPLKYIPWNSVASQSKVRKI